MSVTDAKWCERSDLGCTEQVGKKQRFCPEHSKPEYSKSSPPPSRPARPSWDETWMNTAIDLGKRSRCARGKIGCVIVSADNRVLAASYVGPSRDFTPANENPYTDCKSWCPRSQPGAATDPSYSNCVSCHAEQNAIARCQGDPTGGTVYVNGSVCINCAKLLAAAGVARVVMSVLDSDAHRNPGDVIDFLVKCGIDVTRTN